MDRHLRSRRRCNRVVINNRTHEILHWVVQDRSPVGYRFGQHFALEFVSLIVAVKRKRFGQTARHEGKIETGSGSADFDPRVGGAVLDPSLPRDADPGGE